MKRQDLQKSEADLKNEDDFESTNDQSSTNETEPKSLKKKKSRKKIVLIILGIIACLLIAIASLIVAVFSHYYSLMDTIEEDEDYSYISDSNLNSVSASNSSITLPTGDKITDKNVVNILIMGTDERTQDFNVNARADSVMLVSLNNKTGDIKLVSFERGMTVKIPGRNDDLLTHTFRYGGSKLLLSTVQTHFNLDVDKYVRVNLMMFEKLIDEVGGVDIVLSEEEAYGLNTYPNGNTWKIDRTLKVGKNHLNGYEALQYSRLRWIDSDWQRIQRQRKVVIAVKENLKDLSILELNDLLESCLPYIKTNISSMEFAQLLINSPKYLNSNVEQITIPKTGTFKSLGMVDFEENSEILQDFLYN